MGIFSMALLKTLLPLFVVSALAVPHGRFISKNNKKCLHYVVGKKYAKLDECTYPRGDSDTYNKQTWECHEASGSSGFSKCLLRNRFDKTKCFGPKGRLFHCDNAKLALKQGKLYWDLAWLNNSERSRRMKNVGTGQHLAPGPKRRQAFRMLEPDTSAVEQFWFWRHESEIPDVDC